MEIDSMIKAKKPYVHAPKSKAPKRKGKPLSKRLLSPRQDVVLLKSQRKPPSLANYEPISPRRESNGIVTLDTVAQVEPIRAEYRSDTNFKVINVKRIEEEYRNLKAKQSEYNKKFSTKRSTSPSNTCVTKGPYI